MTGVRACKGCLRERSPMDDLERLSMIYGHGAVRACKGCLGCWLGDDTLCASRRNDEKTDTRSTQREGGREGVSEGGREGGRE